jgi:hypothetical protein
MNARYATGEWTMTLLIAIVLIYPLSIWLESVLPVRGDYNDMGE